MLVRVLVVDDSRFFRRRVTEMLESDSRIKVIGSAENGSEAVQKASRLKPDVITMDIEMPLMDGITATKRILATQKIPILMFSSLTTEGAQATLDALDAGAVDFLPKKFEEISKDKLEAKKQLCDRVLSVAQQYARQRNIAPPRGDVRAAAKPGMADAGGRVGAARAKLGTARASPDSVRPVTSKSAGSFKASQYKIVAIGTSTGGPVALQNVLTKLPQNFPLPMLLVQHMPGSFTGAFAQRLNNLCSITVKEAEDRDELKPGVALLAPGGKQTIVEKLGLKYIVRIQDSRPEQNYKPSVDYTFSSIAQSGIGKALGIILTGMGADGCKGAATLKQKDALIWAQSESSCVVAGMPSAVIEAGLADSVLDLDGIANLLSQGT